jgi:hypothetical protein
VSPRVLSLADDHTLREVDELFKRFTPISFFACVNAFELDVRLSESIVFFVTHLSCLANSRRFEVFRALTRVEYLSSGFVVSFRVGLKLNKASLDSRNEDVYV